MSSGDVATGTGSNATQPQAETRPRFSDECPITGLVNRAKVPNKTERDAVLSDPSIETVMISIDAARRLVQLHNETAQTYFRDDQTVITTTTLHDKTLRELEWTAELEVIRRFGPDYHIPTEYSVYQTMSRSQQAAAIDKCMDGTEWMAEMLANHSTNILVQAKGWLPWQFERCLPTMQQLETNFVVYYATGYKASIYELRDDLNALVSTLNPTGILLIGKQSVRFLRRAVPEVVSAAGFGWTRKCGLAGDGHDAEEHSSWKRNIEQELACGQAILDSYDSTEVTHDG